MQLDSSTTKGVSGPSAVARIYTQPQVSTKSPRAGELASSVVAATAGVCRSFFKAAGAGGAAGGGAGKAPADGLKSASLSTVARSSWNIGSVKLAEKEAGSASVAAPAEQQADGQSGASDKKAPMTELTEALGPRGGKSSGGPFSSASSNSGAGGGCGCREGNETADQHGDQRQHEHGPLALTTGLLRAKSGPPEDRRTSLDSSPSRDSSPKASPRASLDLSRPPARSSFEKPHMSPSAPHNVSHLSPRLSTHDKPHCAPTPSLDKSYSLQPQQRAGKAWLLEKAQSMGPTHLCMTEDSGDAAAALKAIAAVTEFLTEKEKKAQITKVMQEKAAAAAVAPPAAAGAAVLQAVPAAPKSQVTVAQLLDLEEKKDRESKKRREVKAAVSAAAAAASAATALQGPAMPSPESNLSRRYKLLSEFPLLPAAMRRHFWSLKQFEVNQRLHRGYASDVYKARDTFSGEIMAVKVYNMDSMVPLTKVQLMREIKLHGSFAHRNIIELFAAFQENGRVVLAQKYADGGDLFQVLHHAGGRLTERATVTMVVQPLLSCLVFLHGEGIIHRDLKPENMLFDSGVLKVADFGLAINSNDENAVTRAGTLHYMAPEVVKNPLKDDPDEFKTEVRFHYNAVIDSWAVGCIAYELVAGCPLFAAKTQQEVVENINKMEVVYPKRFSKECVNFLEAALERNPADRATAQELLQHPWILHQMAKGPTAATSILQARAAAGGK